VLSPARAAARRRSYGATACRPIAASRPAGLWHHTEEAKAKISAGKMGHTHSPTKPVTSREIKADYGGTQKVKFVTYVSQADAEKKTKISSVSISKCCRKRDGRVSAGGRFWHFATEEDELVGEHIVPRIGDMPRQHKRTIFSESPGGEKVLHESLLAAERNMSTRDKRFNYRRISECCSSKSKRTHHHEYEFYYATPEMIAEFNNNKEQKEYKHTAGPGLDDPRGDGP
jgi:hypothetical protein